MPSPGTSSSARAYWPPWLVSFVVRGAVQLFDESPLRGTANWSRIINGLMRNGGFAAEGLNLLHQTPLLPDLGRQLHARASVRNSLMGMYCKCGALEVAVSFFDRWSTLTGDMNYACCTMVAGRRGMHDTHSRVKFMPTWRSWWRGRTAEEAWVHKQNWYGCRWQALEFHSEKLAIAFGYWDYQHSEWDSASDLQESACLVRISVEFFDHL
ncbi:hypothetical protein ABZP36_031330 [Zizania latifolia]